MEAFQLLSRGGVKFDRKRFKNEFSLFNKEVQAESRSKVASDPGQLPSDLDFFKYSSGTSNKRKIQSTKRCPDSDTDLASLSEDSIRTKLREDKQEGPSTFHHRVSSKGDDIPTPISSFEDLETAFGASSLLLQNLRNHGFTTPTPIQSHGIPILMNKRDLAAISPTGTGKTLSYLTPILATLQNPISKSSPQTGKGVRAVIVAPTRELAHQIHNEGLKLAQGRKWRIMLLSKATANTLTEKAVRDKIDVIVSTPLRLLDSLKAQRLELDNVRFLILDEADRLLDMEFVEQTREIIESCTHPDVQKAVFSATLPSGAEKIALSAMTNPIRLVVGLKDTPLPSIAQSLVYVADESSKLPTLLAHLSQPFAAPIVIFTSTQPRASSLAEQLVLNNIHNVDCLQAGMTQRERDEAMSRMRNGESWVMISTELMARGLDFKGVCGVINFDFPTSVQSYVHRIGRTGRAGREGTAITYFADEDAPYLKSIANVMLQSGSTVPEWIIKLPKPSRMKRRKMGKVQRGLTVTKDSSVGRAAAIKRRDMIRSSKRAKTIEKHEASDVD